MINLKKWLSYIFPVTHRVRSEFNGQLEVTWVNGKKVLDTRNANYSYGTLQRVLEYGLDRISLQHTRHVLLLGLGGGSVIASLRHKYQFGGQITAVELDPAVISIADREFGIVNDEHTTVVHADALTYIKTCHTCYELIIIDLFIDHRVLNACYEADFWTAIKKCLTVHGTIIFNAGINRSEADRQKLSLLLQDEQINIYNKIEGLNTLVIANR